MKAHEKCMTDIARNVDVDDVDADDDDEFETAAAICNERSNRTQFKGIHAQKYK